MSNQVQQWSKLAEDFVKKAGAEKINSTGPANVEVLRKFSSKIPKLNGTITGLDFGAGSGILTSMVSQQTNTQIDFYDVNATMCEAARPFLPESSLVTDNLSDIPDEFYGFVMTNHVVNAMETRDALQEFTTQLRTKIYTGGILSVLINHPSHLGSPHTFYQAYADEHLTPLSPLSLKDGDIMHVKIYDEEGQSMGPFKDCYWGEDTIIDMFSNNGFSFVEKHDRPNAGSSTRPKLDKPAYLQCVFECK